MASNITLFWFRRDLRVADNSGLFHALSKNGNVLPFFIFDKEIIDKLNNKKDPRISFIFDQLTMLKKELEEHGGSLLISYGNPEEVIESLCIQYSVEALYTNHDYEPYANDRDQLVKELLTKKGIAFNSFKDQVIFEKDEVLKDDGKPYTVFTPYMKKWRTAFMRQSTENFPSENYLDQCFSTGPFPDFDLLDTGFTYVGQPYPTKTPDKEIIKNYDKNRDIPAMNGTSRIGLHLRFGIVSIREIVKQVFQLNQIYLNQLIWREFYMMILWHFPRVVKHAFKPKYDNIQWLNDERHFKAWCEGKTGYPIVDAGMRQLNRSGYMHNRARMITASFLTKHLLIDWRWGEAYFAEKLLDFELASNNGSWQWAAGSGCDAAPYYRVFNPELQTKKFDPDFEYIKKWVPEFQNLSYPVPIVDHKFARERVLSEYKKTLNK